MSELPTLFTSPRSQVGFLSRLVFFALAPVGIVLCTAFFPVAGALLGVGFSLLVFFAGETARRWAGSSKLLRLLLQRQLGFEAYYVIHPPRPFAYYIFYPLLFPYWLYNAEARREFWLFRGYTALNVSILLGAIGYQYFAYWWPEFGPRDYLPVFVFTMVVETVLLLSFLMPLTTTVVAFHQTGRRGRLLVLLLVGLLSTGFSIHRLASIRDPIVPFATRARVRIRTHRSAAQAHAAQLAALRAALPSLLAQPGHVEGDGKVEGPPLEAARAALAGFYKPDEALAFDLWASHGRESSLYPGASQRVELQTLVLFSMATAGRRPIWAAVTPRGQEVTDPKKLPRGAFAAMRQAAME